MKHVFQLFPPAYSPRGAVQCTKASAHRPPYQRPPQVPALTSLRLMVGLLPGATKERVASLEALYAMVWVETRMLSKGDVIKPRSGCLVPNIRPPYLRPPQVPALTSLRLMAAYYLGLPRNKSPLSRLCTRWSGWKR